eukprot:6213747-Pleurochrysis_carterae.AAC.3
MKTHMGFWSPCGLANRRCVNISIMHCAWWVTSSQSVICHARSRGNKQCGAIGDELSILRRV